MSDQALRAMLAKAVEHLRASTDLTTDEVIGLAALPELLRTPDVCFSLRRPRGRGHGAAPDAPRDARGVDLLTAPRRPE
ncbi:MAG: hypothetical protein IPL61_17010 [Myxococcales bacterium]|nr:hypothetical protein [Myxococcales bacterium]